MLNTFFNGLQKREQICLTYLREKSKRTFPVECNVGNLYVAIAHMQKYF